MRLHGKGTAIALTAGVALASTGYAIGSQAGDGDAAAAGSGDRGAAGARSGDGKRALTAALADALGISADRVSAAFDELRERHRARFAERLAGELGLEAARVEAALDEVIRAGGPGDRGDFIDDLAEELGVEPGELGAAFGRVRSEGARRGLHHPALTPRARALADALDVSPAELRRALREIGAAGPCAGRGPLHPPRAGPFG